MNKITCPIVPLLPAFATMRHAPHVPEQLVLFFALRISGATDKAPLSFHSERTAPVVREHGHAVRALLMEGARRSLWALREAAFARLRLVARDELEARFLTGALVETVVHWVETDFAEDPRRLARACAGAHWGRARVAPPDEGPSRRGRHERTPTSKWEPRRRARGRK